MEKYLLRAGSTVVATVRDLEAADAKSLNSLPKAADSRLIVVKVDGKSETDAADAVRFLADQGVTKLDVVIANAGIYTLSAFSPVKDMKTSHLTEHFDVNATAVVRLFQAVLPLLEKGSRPVFMTLSSIIATIGGMEHTKSYPLPSYGASKAALDWLTRKIHFEHEDIITFAVHPGYVST